MARTYALWENGKFVCIGTAEEFSEITGRSTSAVYASLNEGRAIRGRYQVTDSESQKPQALKKRQVTQDEYALWNPEGFVGMYTWQEIENITGFPRRRLYESKRTGGWIDKQWLISLSRNHPPKYRPRNLYVYQLYENGEMTHEGTAEELGKEVGIDPKRLSSYARNGCTMAGKYKVGVNGEPPEKKVITRISKKSRKRTGDESSQNRKRRRGAPGKPVPFKYMSPLAKANCLARQEHKTYGYYIAAQWCKEQKEAEEKIRRRAEKIGFVEEDMNGKQAPETVRRLEFSWRVHG